MCYFGPRNKKKNLRFDRICMITINIQQER